MAVIRRRNLLILGGLAAYVAVWQGVLRRPEALAFSEVEGAPGWEFSTAGEVSGLRSQDYLTIGLDQQVPPLEPGRLDAVVHRDTGTGPRVAVFGDYFCPCCRVLVGQLRARQAAGEDLAITWHELPLLGPNSVLVARAAEAAALQGGYGAFYGQLIADGFRPTSRWMGEVAARVGLDGAQVVADMESAAIAERLADSAAAAARLGLFATPGLVVERRAVLGALDRDAFDRLLAES